MSGTAVAFGDMLLPVAFFMLSGVALANTWDSRKNKMKAFFMFVITMGLFGGGYYFMTTGKTLGNVRSNASAKYANFQAQRAAAKLGPTANVPVAPPGMPPPALAPAAAA
jgi:uncharacterized membrane protein